MHVAAAVGTAVLVTLMLLRLAWNEWCVLERMVVAKRERLAGLIIRRLHNVIPPGNLESLLLRAGKPGGLNVRSWQLLRLAIIATMMFLTCLWLAFGGKGNWTIVPLSMLVAAPLPELWLMYQAQRRGGQIRTEFPFFIDLLVICVSAGMSLLEALPVAARRTGGALGSELERALAEMAAGRSCSTALYGIADRTGLPELRSFCWAVSLSLRAGAPIGDVLVQQAQQQRHRERESYERLAGSLSLKLTVCSLCFFFPAIFVLTVLPNILSFLGKGY